MHISLQMLDMLYAYHVDSASVLVILIRAYKTLQRFNIIQTYCKQSEKKHLSNDTAINKIAQFTRVNPSIISGFLLLDSDIC